MKFNNIAVAAAAGIAMACSLAACDSEKDLIIIEGNLPIKTTTLYMVGDATPNGWSIDAPTPLEALGEDPLVFSWEGSLNPGELKLCLTTGSWDAPFIRPKANGTVIGTANLTDEEFAMHAGDPDDKWRVDEAGIYSLTFDLRNWTMSTAYLGGQPEPEIEPIEAENVYMVGDATPNGWNIDAPFALEKKSKYVFTYEGLLNAGELKLCTSTGSWDVPFIRPAVDGSELGKEGFAEASFVYTTGPDNKWRVSTKGIYRLEFNLENWTAEGTFVEEVVDEKNPIETETLFMIGDATPGGWSMDDATEFSRDAENGYIFSWEGELVQGSLKACIERDGTFSCPFIRPSSADCEISSAGVAADDFVFTTGPDDQWRVAEPGKYRIVFDLENYTIAVTKTGNDEPEPGTGPIETETLFMIGDATPGGWSMDDATAFTRDAANKYIFSWEGELATGTMKACIVRDGTFSCPFIRPSSPDCEISAAGVAASDFVYTTDPDNQWRVTEAGKYRIVFDLENYTIAVSKLTQGTPDPVVEPLESETLYMIGDATPGGWSMDDASQFTRDATNRYIFTWDGELKKGDMKACLVPDGTFSCPFVRPATAGCTISEAGVSAPEFVYTTEPDDKWTVTREGKYHLVFDLEHRTFSATRTGDLDPVNPPVNPGKEPIESATLYMIGDATPGGWSMDSPSQFTRSASDKYVFTWEGQLTTGTMKACLAPDGTFSCPFIRPESDGCKIGRNGVEKPGFVYTTDPDDKWNVTEAGKYRITFNLRDWTIEAQYIN